MNKADVRLNFAQAYAEACDVALKAFEARKKRNEGSAMTLSERIAAEIMGTIGRESRIRHDDLIKAVERGLQKWGKGLKRPDLLMAAMGLTPEK